MRFLPLTSICFALAAGFAQAQEDSLLVLVTDVWRNPIEQARIYEGNALEAGATPLARSASDGRCTVSIDPGTWITVDHPDYAPLVIPIEARDIERGYITAILYAGGAVRGTFRVGEHPVESDYVLLQYADPLILGGRLQAGSDAKGRVHFSHVPEGLAYATAGARLGGVLRTTTMPVQVVNESTNYVQFQILVGPAAVRGSVIGPAGDPVAARLTGTIILESGIEEVFGATDEEGAFEIGYLPARPFVLRAVVDETLMKRADLSLGEATLERDIRFDQGATLTVDVESVPEFEWLDVFLLDAEIDVAQIRDRTDRATYLRAARIGRLKSGDTPISVPGVPAGRYSLLALATRTQDGRRTTTVSEISSVSVGGRETSARIRFIPTE